MPTRAIEIFPQFSQVAGLTIVKSEPKIFSESGCLSYFASVIVYLTLLQPVYMFKHFVTLTIRLNQASPFLCFCISYTMIETIRIRPRCFLPVINHVQFTK